jgi:xylulokinase
MLSTRGIFVDALKEAVSVKPGEPPRAMALSVQGEAAILVDRNGRALRHVILGMDTRTGDENQRLVEQFGAERLFTRTGMPVHTMNTLPKLLWHDRACAAGQRDHFRWPGNGVHGDR